MRGRSAEQLHAEQVDMASDAHDLEAEAPVTVFVVEWYEEDPATIDSLWTTRMEAQKRADERNALIGSAGWSVTEWKLRTAWTPEGEG